MAELMPMTLDEFETIPVGQRLLIYQGLSLQIMMDPESVGPDGYQILSYGMFRDDPVREAAMGTDYEPFLDYDVVSAFLNQEGDDEVLPMLYVEAESPSEMLQVTASTNDILDAVKAGAFGPGGEVGISRDDAFLSLPPGQRKQVYDSLTAKVLQGGTLEDEEYGLLGWALGSEEKAAKPSVSADGNLYKEFVRELNNVNPDAADEISAGANKALAEIPLSEWANKAAVGGVVGPFLVTTAWVGGLGATVGIGSAIAGTGAGSFISSLSTNSAVRWTGLSLFLGSNGLLAASSLDNIKNYDENVTAQLEAQQRASVMFGPSTQNPDAKTDSYEAAIAKQRQMEWAPSQRSENSGQPVGAGWQVPDDPGPTLEQATAAQQSGAYNPNESYKGPPGTGDPAYGDDPLWGDPMSGLDRGLGEGYGTASEVNSMYGAPISSDDVPAEYFVSDMRDILDNLTVPQLVEMQDQMVRAGLVEGGIQSRDFTMGSRDQHTERALKYVLSQANIDGKSWQNSLYFLAKEGDKEKALADAEDRENRLKAIGPYRKPAVFEPDYATLAENAKNQMEADLGRKINDWEMAYLVDIQQDDYDEKNQQVLAADRADYDARVRAVEQDLTVGDTTTTGTFTDVDTAARFQESFDAKFEKELARKEVTEGAEERSRTMMQGLNNAMGAIGGR